MSYFTDTIRALKSDGFIAHAKEYKDIRAKYYKRGSQIKGLERELNQAIKERDEARENLIEAMDWSQTTPNEAPCQWRRWRKAAGLEEEQ
jgi:hypothetical protein